MENFNIKFHNGQKEPLNSERMADFERKSIMARLFSEEVINATSLLEQLGPTILDYTNIHDWSQEIPDISTKSARIFIIWAENSQTKEILGVTRGFFIIVPFTFTMQTAEEYYKFQEDTPYYPMAIVTSLKYISMPKKHLDTFLSKLRDYLSLEWIERRKTIIDNLKKDSDLWKRYLFSFKELIHFTFQCPSIDRELIDSLQRNNYRITGIIQLLASPSPSYDEASVKHHILTAKKQLKESIR